MSATRGDPLVTATPPLSGLLVGGFFSSPEYILFTVQEVTSFNIASKIIAILFNRKN
jgi:hypothetical protein